MLRRLGVPLTWGQLAKRTGSEILADNCLGLAAQLAYYFFLALFPALLFLVAIVSFIPVSGLLEAITSTLAHIAPTEVLSIIQGQVLKIAHEENGGLLTLGMIGAVWSTSSGVSAIIDALNQAYGVQDTRPWWKVKLMALGLTMTLALFIVVSFALVLVGPTLGETLAAHLSLGPAFERTWKILQWPAIFLLVSLAVALIYYFAPDVEQRWIWIAPGSVVATTLWVIISLGFKLYVTRFASYNATYGAIGGVIVLMTWFYGSSLAILVGAELNAEIEHASAYGRKAGEEVPGDQRAAVVPAVPPTLPKPSGPSSLLNQPHLPQPLDRLHPPKLPIAPALPPNCDVDATSTACAPRASKMYQSSRTALRRSRNS